MKNYAKVRPRKVYQETLNVEVSFFLKQLVDLVSDARRVAMVKTRSGYINKTDNDKPLHGHFYLKYSCVLEIYRTSQRPSQCIDF